MMKEVAIIILSVLLLLTVILSIDDSITKRNLRNDNKILKTEAACYQVGYGDALPAEMAHCQTVQKKLNTEYLCNENECFAEVK